MNVLRFLVYLTAALWLMMFVGMASGDIADNDTAWLWFAVAVAAWLVWAVVVLVTGAATAWRETIALGGVLATVNIALGVAVAGVALVYGGIRYGRSTWRERRAG